CNGKIILFTEINNSKRGYPTFWTAPDFIIFNECLQILGYYYDKSIAKNNGGALKSPCFQA
ncbi:hypothetical protein, partial [Parabacteroides merdae]|uniref:hypothetical protein n=1 Tax=Parabacteroides merdae TaxID=46503 RepID=UPI0034A489A5